MVMSGSIDHRDLGQIHDKALTGKNGVCNDLLDEEKEIEMVRKVEHLQLATIFFSFLSLSFFFGGGGRGGEGGREEWDVGCFTLSLT